MHRNPGPEYAPLTHEQVTSLDDFYAALPAPSGLLNSQEAQLVIAAEGYGNTLLIARAVTSMGPKSTALKQDITITSRFLRDLRERRFTTETDKTTDPTKLARAWGEFNDIASRIGRKTVSLNWASQVQKALEQDPNPNYETVLSLLAQVPPDFAGLTEAYQRPRLSYKTAQGVSVTASGMRRQFLGDKLSEADKTFDALHERTFKVQLPDEKATSYTFTEADGEITECLTSSAEHVALALSPTAVPPERFRQIFDLMLARGTDIH